MITRQNTELILGDITKVQADAIVNAANSSLMGGSGVDGAIHRAGGKTILEECRKIVALHGECPTGQAVITTAGNMPSKFVVHTVGPVWHGGQHNEAQKLADCYRNSLQIAVDNCCKTVAFPNISTGVYRYPKREAAKIAVDTVNEFLTNSSFIEKVIFVCFDNENAIIIQQLLNEYYV